MTFITGSEEKNSGICIADVPEGSKITIVLWSGIPLKEQVVVRNYGASLMVKDDYQTQIISNRDIRWVSIVKKESAHG